VTTSPFVFDSLIYNGLDNPRDGIGNHLQLLDQLIFNNIPSSKKSLSPIPSSHAAEIYGQVETNLHLQHPDRFKNCLFLDIARDTWNSDQIHMQMEKTVRIKRIFNAVTCVYLMWESDRLWDLYAEMIKIYDFCLVTNSLLDKHLTELGVDFIKVRHPYLFSSFDQTLAKKPASSPVKFGISAGFWPRKNVSMLTKTFAESFAHDQDVKLSIHTRFGRQDSALAEETKTIENLADEVENIEVIYQSFSRSDYIAWMKSLDIYCFVSSGEGYSVTPREALHLGIPVVLHDAHVHQEFAHLPGVIAVPSRGQQKAIANIGNGQFDIGNDWRIDEGALKRAMLQVRNEYLNLKEEIIQGYQNIISLHDSTSIQMEWAHILSEKYQQYRDCVVLYYAQVPEQKLLSDDNLIEQLSLHSSGFISATGYFNDGRVLCLMSEHESGYCLHGPYLHIVQPIQFVLALSIQVFGKTSSADLFVIDVFNYANGSRLTQLPVSGNDITSVENEFQFHIDARIGHNLEFRVNWLGKCDICITKLSLEKI
jgi:glycosyltransferase involved in cell wall biosynthesis